MITKAEKQKWQAEEDARTMARYHEILADKARTQRAMQEAKKQASDLEKSASAMKAAANTKKKK